MKIVLLLPSKTGFLSGQDIIALTSLFMIVFHFVATTRHRDSAEAGERGRGRTDMGEPGVSIPEDMGSVPVRDVVQKVIWDA